MGTRKSVLGSERSSLEICLQETRDCNAFFPLLLETRDHRIGKSSSVVSCNYDPMHKSVRVRFSSYSHRVSGNHHPSFFFLRFSALFLSLLLYSNHNTSFFTIFVTLACVLDACVQIAFSNAFTGG